MRLPSPPALLAVVTIVLVALAWMRPIDHDESQYVASAVLSAHGLLPYRDYAYLQTPLQPLLFAPLAWTLGDWVYPGLRIVNALVGAATVGFTYAAARRMGARVEIALAVAALLACCDAFLFSVGVARNDALPAAMLAAALWLALAERRTWWSAALTGLLLAGAAAAKVSYAIPALTFGMFALFRREHRPLWVIVGALPIVALLGWMMALDPFGFLFGVVEFPGRAPAQYYEASDRAWKLTFGTKAFDLLKFLALGPALLALAMSRVRRAPPGLVGWMVAAGAVAALLPTPTWRQYLLPMLPPLFIWLAASWQARPPGRLMRVAFVVFACAGLAPSIEALAKGGGMREAVAETAALRRVAVAGPVATLSPQFLPASMTIDPRFATGPFYFRSQGLIPRWLEGSYTLVSRDNLAHNFDVPVTGRSDYGPPAAILVGGEGKWTSGDDALDRVLENWALAHDYVRVPLNSQRLRLYAARRALPSIMPE